MTACCLFEQNPSFISQATNSDPKKLCNKREQEQLANICQVFPENTFKYTHMATQPGYPYNVNNPKQKTQQNISH